MARISGMEMPEPTSGTGGGFTNALMGIFRERTRAQKQLELMAYQSAMGVAAHTAKVKLGGMAASEAMKEHYELAHDPTQFRSEEARLDFLGNLRSGGIAEVGASGLKAQRVGRVIQEGGKPSKKTAAPVMGGNKPAQGKPTDPNKPRGGARTQAIPTPAVNEQPQVVSAPNVGNRAPKASKGGYKQEALFTPAGNVTKAAKPKTAKPRVKKPGMGETPSAPTGGMNA